MKKTGLIYLAGHEGLVGTALHQHLKKQGYAKIITRSFSELDLRRQLDVEQFFEQERPEYVFVAAAHVGGIKANMLYPAEFIYNNLAIELNVIHAAYTYKVKKLLFLGSSCIYPRNAPQPLQEASLLQGGLEVTNEAYAVAKIAGIKLCQFYNEQYGTNFITAMPTNLFGPADTFDAERSHVIPSIMLKIHQAHLHNKEQVVLWGTGRPLREFLYSEDCAEACLYLMHHYQGNEPINIGSGYEYSIREIADKIKAIIGYQGAIVFNGDGPDGSPRKFLDSTRLNALGWKAATPLYNGLKAMYQWYTYHVSLHSIEARCVDVCDG
ncbi:MAG: GDP-L-fucose synthase [Candidatus Babeliales bacterium]